MAAQWSPFTAYAIGDVVSYIGLEYSATVANINTPPVPATPTWSPVTPGGGAVANWSTYPAVSDVTLASNNILTVARTDTGIVRVGQLAPLLGSTYIDVLTDLSSNFNVDTAGDVVSSFGTQNYSLNSTGGKTEGIISYNSGTKTTVFNTAPIVPTSGIEVVGSVSASADVVSSFGTQNYSLNSTGGKTEGIVSYNSGTKTTVFNTAPIVPTSGIEVVGSVSASADIVSSFGTQNYSLNTLGSLLPGLLARLDAVMIATGQSASNVYYTGGSGVGTPSSWVPDQSPPEAGGTSNGWRFTKAAGGGGGTKKMNWYPYNPLYGLSPPYTQPVGSFLKRDLQACWAVITPAISISVQGVLFFNIFTYDYPSPPTTAFSNRWDYCANNLALPLTTGLLTLQAGFKYLICCVDADKIVATPGALTTITNCNGQFPSQTQTTKLRDPIDIHTDIPHITFTAVALSTGTDPTPPADPSQVYVSAISLSTTSSSVAAGLDFTVHSIGFRAGGYNVEYTTLYS